MGSTRPNLIHVGGVGLDFFQSTMVSWVEKSPQLDPFTPLRRIIKNL